MSPLNGGAATKASESKGFAGASLDPRVFSDGPKNGRRWHCHSPPPAQPTSNESRNVRSPPACYPLTKPSSLKVSCTAPSTTAAWNDTVGSLPRRPPPAPAVAAIAAAATSSLAPRCSLPSRSPTACRTSASSPSTLRARARHRERRRQHGEADLKRQGESQARTLVVETSSTEKYARTHNIYPCIGEFYGPEDHKVCSGHRSSAERGENSPENTCNDENRADRVESRAQAGRARERMSRWCVGSRRDKGSSRTGSS